MYYAYVEFVFEIGRRPFTRAKVYPHKAEPEETTYHRKIHREFVGIFNNRNDAKHAAKHAARVQAAWLKAQL